MSSHVHFTFILLYLLFFADCWPEDNFEVTNSTLSQPPNLTKTNSSTTCPSNRCLRKCCKATEIYRWLNKTCEPEPDYEQHKADFQKEFPDLRVIFDSRCSGDTIMLNDSVEEDEYSLYENGSLFALKELISFDQYCMDYLAEDGEIRPVVCLGQIFQEDVHKYFAQQLEFLLISIGLGISDFFLILTLGLYLATRRLRRKVHDKCFMCHVATLIIGFSSLIAIQNIDVKNCLCTFLGYSTQFWLLASFFWLNVMCFDMWRTVADSYKSSKNSNTRKLTLYCLYAWGCPSLILILSLLADNYLETTNPLRPGFGEGNCWFRRNIGRFSWLDPRFVHFYSFVIASYAFNVYTFVDTTLIIKTVEDDLKKKHPDSRKHTQKDNLNRVLYFRLFVVMGLYWIMELLSYVFATDNPPWYWIVVDCLTSLQGFYIFIIFICNKRALQNLNKQFFPRRMFLREQNRTMSGRNRSTCSKNSKMSETEVITINNTNSLTRSPNAGYKLEELSKKDSSVFL